MTNDPVKSKTTINIYGLADRGTTKIENVNMLLKFRTIARLSILGARSCIPSQCIQCVLARTWGIVIKNINKQLAPCPLERLAFIFSRSIFLFFYRQFYKLDTYTQTVC